MSEKSAERVSQDHSESEEIVLSYDELLFAWLLILTPIPFVYAFSKLRYRWYNPNHVQSEIAETPAIEFFLYQ